MKDKFENGNRIWTKLLEMMRDLLLTIQFHGKESESKMKVTVPSLLRRFANYDIVAEPKSKHNLHN